MSPFSRTDIAKRQVTFVCERNRELVVINSFLLYTSVDTECHINYGSYVHMSFRLFIHSWLYYFTQEEVLNGNVNVTFLLQLEERILFHQLNFLRIAQVVCGFIHWVIFFFFSLFPYSYTHNSIDVRTRKIDSPSKRRNLSYIHM